MNIDLINLLNLNVWEKMNMYKSIKNSKAKVRGIRAIEKCIPPALITRINIMAL